MAGKVFINYRRDDSIGMAGRLQDRLAQTFGRKKIFMDVDHIPVGADFAKHINSQVAGCDAILVVIGPNWLNAKDESGGRRLDNPDDFVALEIAAALTRDITVIPVLVDGARMPKASELPESIQLLARRQAVEVRHGSFGRDAEALIERMRAALGNHQWFFLRRSSQRVAISAAALMATLLLIIVIAVKSEPPSAGNVAIPNDRKDSAPVPDRYSELLNQGNTESQAGNHDRAIASYSEAIRQEPDVCEAFFFRGNTYARKGDYRKAIADYNKAISISPEHAEAFCARGLAKQKIKDASGPADVRKARRLNRLVCPPDGNPPWEL
jgi:tetratricopeptide (TPR) repeat protein